MQNHIIIKQIKESGYLPQIPKDFGEVLNMLLEPCEFNMDECIEKLSKIPELETTLIQVLNHTSRLNRVIVTLKDAVLYLGAKNTRMIAVAYITKLLLPNKSGRAKIFNNKTYWKHCVGTSIASYMLADKTGLCDKDKIFTYGLIHDIGVTVLDICLPDHLDRIYTMKTEQGIHQIVAEKIVLSGITHTEIGMWLCDEWGIPDEIKEIIGCHHYPFVNTNTSNEVRVMYLADFISANHYQRLLGSKKSFNYSDRVMELLNVSKDLIDEIAGKLPGEVERINNAIDFEFL
ncbi:MAG TPA: HDOD domain-containing protein [Clostridiales bacterium]|nr:HDOD domain-containing protein [Clostridiales bacterium]